MQEDHGYEQEQARVVQVAKAALRDALGPQSGRRELIEDEAKAVMERNPAERKAVARLLTEYTTAVNRLWLYAENTGITGRLTSAWMETSGAVFDVSPMIARAKQKLQSRLQRLVSTRFAMD